MRARWWGLALGVGGLLLAGSSLWYSADGSAGFEVSEALTPLLVALSGMGLLYSGYWHSRRSLVDDRPGTILGWLVGACILFVSVGIVTLVTGSEHVTPVELRESLHVSISVGLLAGMVVGTVHAHALDTAQAVARAEARAEAIQAEQRRLERLNDLLRHYILNGANVVIGYADQLQPAVPAADQDALDAIDRSARTMATLVRHVRALPAVSGGGEGGGSTRVDTAVSDAVDQVRSQYSIPIDVDGRLPPAEAPETLGQSLYLLLDAIAGLTETDGSIRLACERSEQGFKLSIAADGAALPDTLRASLFEPVGTDEGLDLYLARALIEDDCTLQLVRDDGGRLRFELTLDG